MIKMYAYSKAPRTTFALGHPITALQVKKVPYDLRTAYAPRLTAIGAAALVAPVAYGIGKWVGRRSGPRPYTAQGRTRVDEQIGDL